MKYNLIFGGKAGQGPNILSEIVSEGLIKKGYYVFYSRDYQSLIRGGHNFNILTFSENPVYSNQSKVDILVALDENTKNQHASELNKNAVVLGGEEGNMFFAGRLYKLLGIEFSILEQNLKKLKNFEENIKDAKKGYETEKATLKLVKSNKNLSKMIFINGNQGISQGAIRSGLDYYYAYPMTPSTPVMMELAQLSKDNNHKVIELENEIAVMIAALGSSLTGKKAMIGTSGGGFDLMSEGLSLAGQAEIPITVYLSSRPGPSTGLATYTSQDSLNLALHTGHGEFNRVVIAPADPLQSIEATNLAFYFSQKFRIAAFILGDKHLAESKVITSDKTKIIEVKNSIVRPERFNSYEHNRDNDSVATENPSITKKNFDRRKSIHESIIKEASKFEMFKIYGNKNSKNLIVCWGSTKGAVLDAAVDGKIDAKIMQIIFMEPFSEKIRAELIEAKKVIIVENNSTSQLSGLIANKTGFIIDDKNKILRYDGRPFFSDELIEEINKRVK